MVLYTSRRLQIKNLSSIRCKCRRYCRCKSDECGCEEKTNSVDDERNIKMFSYETIQLFNDLELVIYNYIMKNSSQVQYMTIRELADAVHVSTSSILQESRM